MTVDDQLLSKLEKLSYLKIDESKREEMIGQLSEIVNFVDQLSELDTEGIEASFTMSDKGTQQREDSAVSSKDVSEAILAHAPNAQDNYFIVPKIIE